MKREIKFRMWSQAERKYFYDPMNVLECLKQQYIGLWDHEKDGAVFEQYTGLKDKHGKEIYEGDVLLGNGEERVVEFDDYIDCDGREAMCSGWFIDGWLGSRGNIEIIGNIHDKEANQ